MPRKIPACGVMVVALQERAGLSQDDITAETGLSQSFISELKNGKRETCDFPRGMRLYRFYAKRVLRRRLALVPERRKAAATPDPALRRGG
jgi:transcriptional regulator with XRE-family HTH domain